MTGMHSKENESKGETEMKRFNEALRRVRTGRCYLWDLDRDHYGIKVSNLKKDHAIGAEFIAQAASSGKWIKCTLEQLYVSR